MELVPCPDLLPIGRLLLKFKGHKVSKRGVGGHGGCPSMALFIDFHIMRIPLLSTCFHCCSLVFMSPCLEIGFHAMHGNESNLCFRQGHAQPTFDAVTYGGCPNIGGPLVDVQRETKQTGPLMYGNINTHLPMHLVL